jgi:hypothetical protein
VIFPTCRITSIGGRIRDRVLFHSERWHWQRATGWPQGFWQRMILGLEVFVFDSDKMSRCIFLIFLLVHVFLNRCLCSLCTWQREDMQLNS